MAVADEDVIAILGSTGLGKDFNDGWVESRISCIAVEGPTVLRNAYPFVYRRFDHPMSLVVDDSRLWCRLRSNEEVQDPADDSVPQVHHESIVSAENRFTKSRIAYNIR